MIDDGKRPRHFAADIIAEKSIDRRREMLTAVPEVFRDITETHVLNHFEMKAFNGKAKRDRKRTTGR